MTTDRFFSVDGDGTFDTHATAKEAQSAAEAHMDYIREDADDGWDEDAANRIAWGVILGSAERTMHRTAEEAEAAGDVDEAERLRANGWDFIADWRVTPDAPALADVIAEREKQRARWGDAHDDEHGDGTLAAAAALLASSAPDIVDAPEWAEDLRAKLCMDRRAQLVTAAALLLSEIDRLDRAAATTPTPPTPGEE